MREYTSVALDGGGIFSEFNVKRVGLIWTDFGLMSLKSVPIDTSTLHGLDCFHPGYSLSRETVVMSVH